MLSLQMPRRGVLHGGINATPAGRMLEQSGSGFLDTEISWRVDGESEKLRDKIAEH